MNPCCLPPAGPAGGAFKVVAVAASAGGVKALGALLASLPADFPAAVVIVLHLAPNYRSMLAPVLGRRSALPVRQAADGDVLHPGTVFVAPPDHHLLVNADGRLSLSHSGRVHFARPAADRLFESVAASCHGRGIAVVLTGQGCDGADGLRAVKAAGGTAIVQTEASSEFGSMPKAAILTGKADFIVPLEAIAPTLIALVGEGHPS